MKIVPVKISDAQKLSHLAKDIYRECYLYLWKTGGADWYMEEYAYHPDTIRHEIDDPQNLHYFVYNDSDKLMGYLKIKIQTIYDGNPLEIERIYLHQNDTGKGIGQELIQFAIHKALEFNKKSIILKAMDSNLPAIRFYTKNGFSLIGNFDLDFELIKPEFKGMVIMEKKLTDS